MKKKLYETRFKLHGSEVDYTHQIVAYDIKKAIECANKIYDTPITELYIKCKGEVYEVD